MAAPIFILAGEPSGDQLAARVMGAIETHYGPQEWVGVGDEAMAAYGLKSWADMEQLSIIGFGAALTAYPKLSALMNRLVDRIMETRPKLVITVDAKGFSLRLAARLKARMKKDGWQVPIVHTVAPTVWAWGEWRKHSVAKAVDCLLCLFPFEPDYFTPLGLHAECIGHPDAARDELVPSPDVGPSGTLVLLPGSRRSEITRILPAMLAAAQLIKAKRPDITLSLATTARMTPTVEAIVRRYDELDVDVTNERSRFYADVKAADAVIAASGTVTLQVALMGAPCVATYIAGGLSASIGRRLVAMDRVILPNAIFGRAVFPFLFQEQARPPHLATAVLSLLADPDAKITARSIADELRLKLAGGEGDDGFDRRVTTALAPYLAAG